MASKNLTCLKPTSHTMDNVSDKTRYIITRSKAQALVDILRKEYPVEASLITASINYELEHGQHDTHIAFYVNNNDIDGIIVMRYACTSLIFNYIGD